MKKSDLLTELEKKFDYLPKREVERTLKNFCNFFPQKFKNSIE